MILQELTLTNYKNYEQEHVALDAQFTILTGDNGMGKTNVLDAIYYVCLGKSYFSGQDRYVVRSGADFTRLEARFVADASTQKVVIKLVPRKLKEVSINGKKHDRLVDHLGRFSCVVIAPIDVQLMLDGSEQRRRYINNTIIQYDKQYTQALLTYNRLLRQRNALLKQMAENRTFNVDLLDSLTVPMVEPGTYIYQARQIFTTELTRLHNHYYALLSGGNEVTELRYKTPLNEGVSMLDAMRASYDKDRVLTRTTVGIHKDDLEMIMDDRPLKFYGSQGQLKSYVLAMKLSQYEILNSHTGAAPILLLDDVFDKLDRTRVSNLLAIVESDKFGQVVITDTSMDRVAGLLSLHEQGHTTYHVDRGSVKVVPSPT